jgi:hypothetical protein
MATELAHSPLAANAQVVLVGRDFGAAKRGDFERVRVTDTWVGVAADLAAWNDQSRDALAAHEWPGTFAARGHDADHDALIPLIVIATELPDGLDLLGVLTAGPAAAAAVIVGDALRGATLIDCAPDQRALPQLGLTCRPLTLDGPEVDAVADLVEATPRAVRATSSALGGRSSTSSGPGSSTGTAAWSRLQAAWRSAARTGSMLRSIKKSSESVGRRPFMAPMTPL